MNTPNMQELLEAGAHFGHKVSRSHPRMKEYIYGARDGVSIIDLAKTEKKLKEAIEAAFELGKEGKTLLIVGTKKQAKELVKELAKKTDAFYLTQRWIGGLLTNFDEVRKNIKKLNDLKEEQEKGSLSRYTKKEQLLIAKRLSKFDEVWGGVSQMDRIPDAIFVVDASSDKTAVTEVIKKGISLFGITDTNSDPSFFDYPIPANDDGIKSIKLILESVIGAYGKGKGKVESPNKVKKSSTKTHGEEIVKDVVMEEAAQLEEEVEKKVVKESERKV